MSDQKEPDVVKMIIENAIIRKIHADPSAACIVIRGNDNVHCTCDTCPDRSAPVHSVAAMHIGGGEMMFAISCEHCWPATDARIRGLFGNHLLRHDGTEIVDA